MSVPQAFIFGAMVAWTPSLILLAWLLWRAPSLHELEHEDGPVHEPTQ